MTNFQTPRLAPVLAALKIPTVNRSAPVHMPRGQLSQPFHWFSIEKKMNLKNSNPRSKEEIRAVTRYSFHVAVLCWTTQPHNEEPMKRPFWSCCRISNEDSDDAQEFTAPSRGFNGPAEHTRELAIEYSSIDEENCFSLRNFKATGALGISHARSRLSLPGK